MLCAKTVGNATLIIVDKKPLLATDPWLEANGAYFGSWQLSHIIPERELSEIKDAKYIWFSHGHPDHLNADSTAHLKTAKILLPDHVGGRICEDLVAQGFDVSVMQDRRWYDLSDRVKVCCIADYNQDAILLVDANGHLFVNLNDASDRGWGRFVRRAIKEANVTYLLKISGYGDADMINFYREDGTHITPEAKVKRVGRRLQTHAELYGVDYVVPFSSLHRYQRTDSSWANKYTTPVEAYKDGFKSKTIEIAGPFVAIDCVSGAISELEPPLTDETIIDPKEFGDDWSDLLERSDLEELDEYFRRMKLLGSRIGFVNFRVGGKDHEIRLNRGLRNGITFEVPRNSLMTSVRYKIFDDLLIGNFMRTTLHGMESLSPNFTPIVAKYADNGGVYSKEDYKKYLAEYRNRAMWDYLFHKVARKSQHRFRQFVTEDSLMFNIAKRAYITFRRR